MNTRLDDLAEEKELLESQLDGLTDERDVAQQNVERFQLAVETYEANQRAEAFKKAHTDADLRLRELSASVNSIKNRLLAVQIAPVGQKLDDDPQAKELNDELLRLDGLVQAVRVEKDVAFDGMHQNDQLYRQNKTKLRGASYSTRTRQAVDEDLFKAREDLGKIEGKIVSHHKRIAEILAEMADIERQIDERHRLALAHEQLARWEWQVAALQRAYADIESPFSASDICMQELLDLQAYIAAFKKSDEAKHSAAWSQKLKALHGFMVRAYNNKQIDEESRKLFQAILRDGVVRAEEAIEAYDFLRQSAPQQLPVRTFEDIVGKMMERYDAARLLLKTELDRSQALELNHHGRQLNQAGYHLIHTLDKANSLGFSYRIEVLHAARKVHADCGNHEKQAALSKLIERNIDGKASEVMEVVGSVLMIVGAAMMVLSAYAALLSLGFAAPLAIAGLALGGIIFGSGLALVASGGPKRTEKALMTYKSDVVSVAQHGMFRSTPESMRAPSEPKVGGAALGIR